MDNLEIIMFKEINNYREKYYGLTFRQWIFAILIAIVVIPTYVLLPKYTIINEDIASYIVIAEAGIIGFFGFIPVHNLPAEQIVPYWYRHYFAFAKPLEYITNKEWEEMHDKKNKKNGSKANKKKTNKQPMETETIQEPITVKKTVEQATVVDEGKPQLTKKQLRQQNKQQKQLAKAKKKYGYLLDEETGAEQEIVTEPVKDNDNVDKNAVVDESTTTEPTNEVVENTKDILNSFTQEQKQALIKLLNNDNQN